MKKKFIHILIIVIAIIGIVLVVRFLFGSEDTWFCQDGRWLKHGQPSAPKPTSGCGEIQIENVRINSPQPDQTLSFPLAIEGEARGNWYFEASFPIRLLDSNGEEIALVTAQAQSDWMTTDFVPFKAIIDLSQLPKTEKGTLVFQKDNPSGLPENDQEIRISVYFPKSEDLTAIKVFFNNNNLDPEYSCYKVFPVDRFISKTPTVARAALESLLRGTSFKEQADSFFTSINPGVKIQELTIENNIARVDFDSQLEFQVGGSCRVSAIWAQITETLKQFSTVKEVIVSIDGRTEYILQP